MPVFGLDICIRTRRGAVVAVALVLLVSGCLGLSGGGATQDGAVASPTPTPTVTDTPMAPPTATPTPAATPAATPTPTASETNRTRLETLVHAQVNDRRREHGLAPLDRDGALRAIARNHSQDMFDRAYFAHTGPDGETRADRYDRAGYECRIDTGDSQLTGAENLYTLSVSGQSLSDRAVATRVVEAWMNSSVHRKQILNAAWEKEGIGAAVGTRNGSTVVYVTQNFC